VKKKQKKAIFQIGDTVRLIDRYGTPKYGIVMKTVVSDKDGLLLYLTWLHCDSDDDGLLPSFKDNEPYLSSYFAKVF
jgi:hypothetical protein